LFFRLSNKQCESADKKDIPKDSKVKMFKNEKVWADETQTNLFPFSL